MKLLDFYTKLFQEKLKATPDQIQSLLQADNPSEAEVPEEILEVFSNLLNIDEAVNNTKVRDKVKTSVTGEFHKTLTQKFQDVIKNNSVIPDEEKENLLSLGNTFEFIPQMSNAFNKVFENKRYENNNEAAKRISILEGNLAEQAAQMEQALKEKDLELAERHKRIALKHIYKNHPAWDKTSLKDDPDRDAFLASKVQRVLSSEFGDDEAKLQFDPSSETFKVIKRNSEENLNVFRDGKEVKFNDVLDLAFQTITQANPGTPPTTPPTTPVVKVDDNKQDKNAQKALNAIDKMRGKLS